MAGRQANIQRHQDILIEKHTTRHGEEQSDIHTSKRTGRQADSRTYKAYIHTHIQSRRQTTRGRKAGRLTGWHTYILTDRSRQQNNMQATIDRQQYIQRTTQRQAIIHTGGHTHIEVCTHIQAGRQTAKQTPIQRHTYIHTGIHTYRQAGRYTYRQSNIQRATYIPQ